MLRRQKDFHSQVYIFFPWISLLESGQTPPLFPPPEYNFETDTKLNKNFKESHDIWLSFESVLPHSFLELRIFSEGGSANRKSGTFF